MRKDERPLAPFMGNPMEEPSFDIGRDTELAGLQDNHADPAVSGALALNLIVKCPLGSIKRKRDDRPWFRTESETRLGVVLEVVS